MTIHCAPYFQSYYLSMTNSYSLCHALELIRAAKDALIAERKEKNKRRGSFFGFGKSKKADQDDDEDNYDDEEEVTRPALTLPLFFFSFLLRC